ncbi:MAG: hypothetical protein AB7N71_09015 [Phycisphaerae bacterium]
MCDKQGNKDAAKQKPSTPCDDPTKKCPLEEAKLITVEFLDGDNTKELAQNDKHWVNLPRDAKWVDGTHVKNIDRLSHKPRVKVKFDKPGAHSFKVKYVPDASNIAYSAGEKGRNEKFKYEEAEKNYTTDADGTKVIPEDFFVTACGTHKYKLKAEDTKGNKAESHTIEIHRLCHLIELKMAGIASAANTNVLEAEYDAHKIKIVKLAEKPIPKQENIGSDAESTTFQNNCRTAYTGSDAVNKEPYVIALGYTDHLAVKNANQTVRKTGVQAGPGKPAAVIPIRGAGLRAGDGVNDRYLWQNIVTGESWFVSAKFEPADGSAAVNIPAAKCTAVAVDAANPSMAKSVSIDVTGLPNKVGRISLNVNWVDRMRAGLSFGSGNLICVCTKAWWRPKSTQAQNEVMIHEFGHQIKMVVDGTGKNPDKVSTQYTARGHVGPHCHHDLPLQASFGGVGGSKCVMFGSTNGKSAFCVNCAPAVKKQDLSDGWTRF